MRELTPEEQAKVRQRHGDKYDYGAAKYISYKSPVSIRCPEHGFFEMPLYRHMRGEGCRFCAGNAKKTTAGFVEQAQVVHGLRYDYTKVAYVGTMKKVEIVCREHGPFWQEPISHLRGRGCSVCSGTRKKSTQQVVAILQAVYGDRYLYHDVSYKGNKKPITLICPEHGEFQAYFGDLAYKKHIGCPTCARQSAGKKNALSQDDFIANARAIHGDKYDYSKVVYKNTATKVVIICPTHGEFIQSPNCHTNKSSSQGCPTCSDSKGEKRIAEILKELGFSFKREVKFRSCRYKRTLPFDFLVKVSDKKGVLIEYHGAQHYRPVRWHSTMSDEDMQSGYDVVVRRDAIKANWAKANGIPFLVVPYWDQSDMARTIEEFTRGAM